MKIKYLASAIALAVSAVAHSGDLPTSPHPVLFDKQGAKVIDAQKGPSGLKIWTIENKGLRTVVYSTPDDKTIIAGQMWDGVTGANLSDRYLAPLAAAQATQAAAAAPQPAAVKSGEVPKPILNISKLRGFSMGPNTAVDKVVYVMFDPRCPYCHQAYQSAKALVAKGYSFKWIPIVTLPHNDQKAQLQSTKWIAEAFASNNPARALDDLMTQRLKGIEPKADTINALQSNEMFFQASFDSNPGAGAPVIPTAYYVTKDGVPNMLTGLADPNVMNQVINTLRK